jgi:hypothetical protein
MSDHLLRAKVDVAIVITPQNNDYLDNETPAVEQVFLDRSAALSIAHNTNVKSRSARDMSPISLAMLLLAVAFIAVFARPKKIIKTAVEINPTEQDRTDAALSQG